MTLTELRYVVAVADARHFGRAAERCHVSQPSLSASVKNLEEELGVTLFERGKRGVFLTEAERKNVIEMAYQTLVTLAYDQVRWNHKRENDPQFYRKDLGVLERARSFHEPTRAFWFVRREDNIASLNGRLCRRKRSIDRLPNQAFSRDLPPIGRRAKSNYND